jgi:hypothetical protein
LPATLAYVKTGLYKWLENIIEEKDQVPHSQCSLGAIPKFLPNFRSKNNTLKENV